MVAIGSILTRSWVNCFLRVSFWKVNISSFWILTLSSQFLIIFFVCACFWAEVITVDKYLIDFKNSLTTWRDLFFSARLQWKKACERLKILEPAAILNISNFIFLSWWENVFWKKNEKLSKESGKNSESFYYRWILIRSLLSPEVLLTLIYLKKYNRKIVKNWKKLRRPFSGTITFLI